jgi:hypothetical protein
MRVYHKSHPPSPATTHPPLSARMAVPFQFPTRAPDAPIFPWVVDASRPVESSAGAAVPAELFASHRLLGTPAALRVAQGQGTVPPMLVRAAGGPGESTPPAHTQYVNPATLFSQVQRTVPHGDGVTWDAPVIDIFNTAAGAGVPMIRAEQILGPTFSGAADGGCCAEVMITRPMPRTAVPGGYTLASMSERELMWEENKTRLAGLHERYVKMRLRASA